MFGEMFPVWFIVPWLRKEWEHYHQLKPTTSRRKPTLIVYAALPFSAATINNVYFNIWANKQRPIHGTNVPTSRVYQVCLTIYLLLQLTMN